MGLHLAAFLNSIDDNVSKVPQATCEKEKAKKMRVKNAIIFQNIHCLPIIKAGGHYHLKRQKSNQCPQV